MCGHHWAEWARELLATRPRSAVMELTCPKCHGTMRTYERNGVHVDQCTECRGIFLDRGELDRLIDAENDWHGAGKREHRSSGHEEHGRQEHGRQEYGHQQYGNQQGAAAAGGLGGVVGEVLRQVQGSKHSSHSSSGHRRKKESFLGDLFG